MYMTMYMPQYEMCCSYIFLLLSCCLQTTYILFAIGSRFLIEVNSDWFDLLFRFSTYLWLEMHVQKRPYQNQKFRTETFPYWPTRYIQRMINKWRCACKLVPLCALKLVPPKIVLPSSRRHRTLFV